jgi:hypothetical protein
MTIDSYIVFYTKKNPKKYGEIIKEYEKEIDEKLPNISTVMGIYPEPENIFGEEYYYISITTDYNPYASYFYEEDGYPIEEARQIAKRNTQILLDIVKKVIKLIRPEFGFGDIYGKIDDYVIELEKLEKRKYKKKYKNVKEYLAHITDNFTKLPWLFVYNEDLDIKISDKVKWYEDDEYIVWKEPKIYKIGKCILYILKEESVALNIEEDIPEYK